MTQSVWTRWGFGLALAMALPALNAAIVTYNFSGTINFIQNSLSYTVSSVQIGQAFNATLRYDTDKSTVDFNSPSSGTPIETAYKFGAGGYQLSVAIGPASSPLFTGSAQSTSSSIGGRVNILNNFGAQSQDWFQTRASAFDGFVASSQIDGFTWRQTDITLKNYGGALYSSTALPNQIAALNNFNEAFATVYLSRPNPANTSTEFAIVQSSIDSIEAVLSKLGSVSINPNEPTAVLDFTNAGGLKVDAPAGGTFSATYSQQAANEVDFSSFNFFIPGSIFQVWDLDFTGTINPGEFVEMVFRYDDTGMTVFQEQLLDIFHEVSPGNFVRLFGVVDTAANTITARTSSFSPFVLGQVPAPASLWLSAAALAALVGIRRRRKPTG